MANYQVVDSWNPLLNDCFLFGDFDSYGDPQPTGRTAIKGELTYTEFEFTEPPLWFWQKEKKVYQFVLDSKWKIDPLFVIEGERLPKLS